MTDDDVFVRVYNHVVAQPPEILLRKPRGGPVEISPRDYCDLQVWMLRRDLKLLTAEMDGVEGLLFAGCVLRPAMTDLLLSA